MHKAQIKLMLFVIPLHFNINILGYFCPFYIVHKHC